ncbi:hypothetical protein BC830DRAFT_1171729 [Chytriomyces sp. MP71]|nr:hypothetical protein BC830DRAFT_1171729 [Chytriomyces sp. MP71]
MGILAMLPMLVWLLWRRFLGSGGSFIEVFAASVRKYPKKEALVFTGDGRRYTYQELNDQVNQVANWLHQAGITKGQVIAIMCDNSPEFIILLLAVIKLGGCVACVNVSLKSQSLLQCIRACCPAFMLVQSKFSESLPQELDPAIGLIVFGDSIHASAPNEHDVRSGVRWLDCSQASTATPDMTASSQTKVDDLACLIFTSGTTGLPKPAILTHAKVAGGSALMRVAGISHADRIYSCLPLFHANALVLGFGTAAASGATFILAPAFSAARFVRDCVAEGCTAVQYIGELPRFLVHAPSPPAAEDLQRLRIRIAYGNGMRSAHVWTRFAARFNVAQVFEFYGSTEGIANMYNFWKAGGKGVGACGRLSPLLAYLQGFSIVKQNGEGECAAAGDGVFRDAEGRCVVCDVGEVGELIAKIDDSSLTKAFKGYFRDKEGNRRKVLENVFIKGDRYFRTGDIFYRDKDNFVYFVDRIGDTFRWRGENVSTQQVGEILSQYPGVCEANVYGVHVAGSDGRAGMAALTVSDSFAMEGFGPFLAQELPKYALPIWIRLLHQNADIKDSHTATFKQVKSSYQAQGYNPNLVEGASLFWLQPGAAEYRVFSSADYQTILMNGLSKCKPTT